MLKGLFDTFRHKDYAKLNAIEFLPPGKHMVLRGCMCRGVPNENLEPMADCLVADGTPFAYLTCWSHYTLPVMKSCERHGKLSEFRFINLFGGNQDDSLKMFNAKDGAWHSHRMLGTTTDHPAMGSFLPSLLTEDASDPSTAEHGRFLALNVPEWEVASEATYRLTEEAISLVERWAMRRVAEGFAPRIFLNCVLGFDHDAYLASFLRRMEEKGVSVIVCDRYHIPGGTHATAESDLLYDIDLSGACWTRADPSTGKEPSAEDRRRNNDEGALLVIKGPVDLMKIVRKSRNALRTPYLGRLGDWPTYESAETEAMRNMIMVKGDLEALRSHMNP